MVWWTASAVRPAEPMRAAAISMQVPAVLEITEARLLDSATMQVAGSVELTYDANLQSLDAAARGVTMPGVLPGSFLREVGDEAGDAPPPFPDEVDEGPAPTQISTWEFDVRLAVPDDSRVYPFERIDALRLRHVGARSDVGLALTVRANGSAPGGWRFSEPFATVAPGDSRPGLDHVVPLRRTTAGILVRVLLPLAAVFALLFVHTGYRSGSPGAVITSASVLLLAVGYAHARLRDELGGAAFHYLETFHGIAYLAIVGVASAALHGRNLARLRVLFWPLVTGLALLSSLLFLPGWLAPASSTVVPLLLTGVVLSAVLLFRGVGPAPTAVALAASGPVKVHSLVDRGRTRCGAASDFVSADRDQVSCGRCHELLYEASATPPALDTWPE